MNNKRTLILAAANQVVERDGVASLTLEAVAREAGVSKGGLPYHFSTKEALIQGMLKQLLDEFTSAMENETAQDAAMNPRGRWTRAYVRATFSSELPLPSLSEGLLAAIATNPELLKPMQDAFATWQARLEEDGLDPAVATAVRYAADGLWFAELMGFAPPSADMRTQVYATLMTLIETALKTH